MKVAFTDSEFSGLNGQGFVMLLLGSTGNRKLQRKEPQTEEVRAGGGGGGTTNSPDKPQSMYTYKHRISLAADTLQNKNIWLKYAFLRWAGIHPAPTSTTHRPF